MNYPWQYDETTQVGTDYRDPQEVAAYDRRMQQLRSVEAEVEDIRKRLALAPTSTVWEIGSGTGACALALASHVRHICASDISPAMLEYARQQAARRGVRNVSFQSGGFLSGFRPAQPVDGVVSQLALHHLPDFWKFRALGNIAACLRPAGRLYLRDVVFPSSSVDFDAYFQEAIDGVRSHAGDEMARQTIEHIRTEFSTFDWILEGMLARTGLTMVTKTCQGFTTVYVCEKQ